MAKSFRALLKKHHFTVPEFAQWARKSERTIWRWYQNDRCPYFYEFVLETLDAVNDHNKN